MLKTYLAVMLGGAVGTGARLWLSSFLTLRYGEDFPVGILVVNVLGCVAMGLFSALTAQSGAYPLPALARMLVMTGFLGGFTTFSSFSLQTLTLAMDGHLARAALNVTLSVVLCLAGVWIGQAAATIVPGQPVAETRGGGAPVP